MELALGTVQWGVAYGIAGSGAPVREDEVRAILEHAWKCGVRTLDTAAAYGDIEERLATLSQGLRFDVISKIPTIPPELSATDAAGWAVGLARRSHKRLGDALRGLLCHRAEDLAGVRGASVYRALAEWGAAEGVAIGASVYDPRDAVDLARHRGIAITQLPGNAFDQRLASTIPQQMPDLEVHLRSAFLQGLLLMDVDVAVARLPMARIALRRWHAWCVAQALSPLIAALSIVRGFAAVSTVVVGVDSKAQFAEIINAWNSARSLDARELACEETDIIDPRRWSVSR